MRKTTQQSPRSVREDCGRYSEAVSLLWPVMRCQAEPLAALTEQWAGIPSAAHGGMCVEAEKPEDCD